MAWVSRGTRRYYYRSRTVDGIKKKIYCGHDQYAEIMAQADADQRGYRQRAVQRRRSRRAEAEAVDLLVRGFLAEADLLIRAALLLEGFYQHDRGPWRKRRGRPNARNTDTTDTNARVAAGGDTDERDTDAPDAAGATEP